MNHCFDLHRSAKTPAFSRKNTYLDNENEYENEDKNNKEFYVSKLNSTTFYKKAHRKYSIKY